MQVKVKSDSRAYKVNVRVHKHRLAKGSEYDLIVTHCALCGQLIDIKEPLEAYND